MRFWSWSKRFYTYRGFLKKLLFKKKPRKLGGDHIKGEWVRLFMYLGAQKPKYKSGRRD